MFKTFADALTGSISGGVVKESTKIVFSSKEEVRMQFLLDYVGKVVVTGSTVNIQTTMEIEGYCATKVTPLRDFWCLIEETDEGFLDHIFGEEEVWWKKLFVEINRWNEEVIDTEKALWI